MTPARTPDGRGDRRPRRPPSPTRIGVASVPRSETASCVGGLCDLPNHDQLLPGGGHHAEWLNWWSARRSLPGVSWCPDRHLGDSTERHRYRGYVNKSDPNDIVDNFVATTNDALDDWRTIDGVLSTQGVRLRRRAAADSFMALAVSWESFLSRWLVAAINRNASQAVRALETKIREYAIDNLRVPEAHVATTLVTRSHLTVAEVRRLLDPEEFNIMISSRADLKKFAMSWLADPYQGAATGITTHQFRTAHLTRLVRNVLAHHSTTAITAANEFVTQNSTPATLRWTGSRRLDVAGWRRYLFTTTTPVPRVEILHNELATLAGRFAIP